MTAPPIALVDRLRRLPPEARRAILDPLTAPQLAVLLYEWRRLWARPDQLAPVDPEPWTYLALIGGRGSGKTRSAAEVVIERVRQKKARKIHLLAATYDDAAETMIEGESGILPCSPPDERPRFVRSRGGGLLFWPNGARGRVFSAEEPKRCRGPQCDLLWADDVAAWGVNADETWAQAMYGFRKRDPKAVISSTPAAMDLLVALIGERFSNLVLRHSASDDNRNNLSEVFFRDVLEQFAGTQLEEQERYGKLLVDENGAMFRKEWIRHVATPPELERIVVAIDPALTEETHSDETGIVVLGLGVDGRLYVLADFTGKHSPETWAKLVVRAFKDYQADCVVAETNAGKNLVRRNLTIEAPGLPIVEVTTIRGKAIRAESLSNAYQKGLVSHVTDGPQLSVRGQYRQRKPFTLEGEMTAWIPKKSRSPNGVDALVHGAAELRPFDSAAEDDEGATTDDIYEELAGDSRAERPCGFDRRALTWR